MIPTGELIQRKRHFSAFVEAHYDVLYDMYRSLVYPINPQISLNDWMNFAYYHTNKDGLGLYS